MRIGPGKLGQPGDGIITSSPGSSSSCNVVWMACMPPPVTKKRSAENGPGQNRS